MIVIVFITMIEFVIMTYKSYSHLYMDTTPRPNHPNNNIPPPTSHPYNINNSYIGYNDWDVFHLTIRNMVHSNTSFFTNNNSNAHLIF